MPKAHTYVVGKGTGRRTSVTNVSYCTQQERPGDLACQAGRVAWSVKVQ